MVLYTCTRLHRTRRRFKHFWSISLSRPLIFSNKWRPVWVFERPLPRRSSGSRPRQPDRDPTPSTLTTKDSSSTATCRSRPLPPFLTGGSVAPLSTAALLSTLEIGLGPSAARPLRRLAGWPIPNTISGGGGLAEGNGSAFNWLSRARRAPSDFPSPVAPPPSCELVATRGAETRERSAGAGLALASLELDSRSTRPGLGSCGCVGR